MAHGEDNRRDKPYSYGHVCLPDLIAPVTKNLLMLDLVVQQRALNQY